MKNVRPKRENLTGRMTANIKRVISGLISPFPTATMTSRRPQERPRQTMIRQRPEQSKSSSQSPTKSLRAAWLVLILFTLVPSSTLAQPATYTSCFQKLRSADANSDNKLLDDEYLQAIRLLSGGAVSISSMEELPDGFTTIYGAAGIDLTTTALTDTLCDSFFDAILVETKGTSITDQACDLAMAIGDRNRDNVLVREDMEFSRFANQISGGEYGFATPFEELPQPVQEIFRVFHTNDGIPVDGSKPNEKAGASPEQLEWLRNVCRQTAVATVIDKFGNPSVISITSAPTGTPIDVTEPPPSTTQPPPTPSKPAFDFSFYDCRLSMSFSDVTRDSKIDKREYFRFLDRLSAGAVAEYTNFAGLPEPLQKNYEALIVSDGDGTHIDVADARPNIQLNEEREQSLQRICDGTKSALNEAFSTTEEPPTEGPPPETETPPIEVDLAQCKRDLLISDLSRDLYIDAVEYVRFVSRLTEDVGISDPFDTLSESLQETFGALAKDSGDDPNTFFVDGIRPNSSVDDEQENFLKRVCRDTLVALQGETTDPPTESPPESTEPPAESPVEGSITVYNAFILSNPDGLGAVLLRVGRNRLALNRAYATLADIVVTSYMSSQGETIASRNVFLRGKNQRRRMEVTGLVEDSSELFELVDSACPENVEAEHTCVTVYAAFEVSIKDEANPAALAMRLTAFAQDSVLKDEALQTLIEEEGPDATLKVVSTTGIKEKDEPTEAPTRAPTEGDSEGEPSKEGGGGMSIIIIVVIALAAIVGGGVAYWYYKKQNFGLSRIKSMLKKSEQSSSSKKTSDGGSINDDDPDPEMAPAMKKRHGDDSSQNSDVDELFGDQQTSQVDDDDDEDSANFSDHDRSPERSRMRHTLDRTTGNVLGAFGGLTGGLVHGLQQGVQTVGGEVVKGVKTVGKGVKTVGNTTLNVGKTVGDAVGVNHLVGHKKRQGEENEEEVEVLDTQEQHVQDEIVDDDANYGFEDPEEVLRDPFSESASNAWENVHDNKENDWNGRNGEAWGGADGFDGSYTNSYNDEESASGEESFIDGDDFTRGSGSKTSSNVAPGNMRQLGRMVDKGNWDDVMEAAAKFENNFTDDHSEPSRDAKDDEHSDSGSSDHDEDLKEVEEGDELLDESLYDNGFEESHDLDESLEALSIDEKKRREQYKQQVTELVSQCVPDEIGNVDVMLEQFAGRETELINTLRTMCERSATQRARKAVHRSKPIQERETQGFAAGGADGSAAIAAASTIGGAYENTRNRSEEEFDDDQDGEEDSYYSGSYSEGSGSGSYYDDDEDDRANKKNVSKMAAKAFGKAADFGKHGIAQVKGATEFGASKVKGAAEFGANTFKGAAEFGANTFKGASEFGVNTFKGASEFGVNTFKGATDFGANKVKNTAETVGRFGNKVANKIRHKRDEEEEEFDDEVSGSYGDEEASDSYESGSGRYDDDEASGSFESGSYEQDHQDDQYDDDEGSYDDEASGSYQDGSYDDQEDEASGSYQGSYQDQEGSYDDEEGSYEDGSGNYDDQEGSYDDGEGSYDEEASGSYNDGSYDDQEEEQSGSYDDEEGSGSYDDQEGSYDDEEGSGNYDDQEGSYDDDASGSYDDEVSGSYDDEEGSYEEGSGSYDDDEDGSYEDGSGSFDE